jgi:hypothetical protein
MERRAVTDRLDDHAARPGMLCNRRRGIESIGGIDLVQGGAMKRFLEAERQLL